MINEVTPQEVRPNIQPETEMPVKVTWSDVKFTVKTTAAKKAKSGPCAASKASTEQQILKGCSGSALPGQVTYIMGSSGAGKTSLLNIISDRFSTKRGNKMEGSVWLNDKTKLDQQVFGQVGAYVMQDDILFAYFTVEEAFNFAARLKLNIPRAEQDIRVQTLMQELGLWDVRKTLVGN